MVIQRNVALYYAMVNGVFLFIPSRPIMVGSRILITFVASILYFVCHFFLTFRLVFVSRRLFGVGRGVICDGHVIETSVWTQGGNGDRGERCERARGFWPRATDLVRRRTCAIKSRHRYGPLVARRTAEPPGCDTAA